jgi:hypothetical protein
VLAEYPVSTDQILQHYGGQNPVNDAKKNDAQNPFEVHLFISDEAVISNLII